MQEGIFRIRVENFKSLKNCEINFKTFNVLIGPNGSGKTNVLELFKFISLCIGSTHTPPYPFGPWWGFGNLVWSHDERLPIFLQIDYTIDGHDVTYQTHISGADGNLEFLDEKIAIPDYLCVDRSFGRTIYKIEKEFWEKHRSEKPKFVAVKESMHYFMLKKPHTLNQPSDVSILKNFHQGIPHTHYDSNTNLTFLYVHPVIDASIMIVPSPSVNNRYGQMVPLCKDAADVLAGDGQTVFLRQLNYNSLRQSAPANQQSRLEEDGSGLINLLFGWYTKNHGRLPERFEIALEALFPKWQISFELTGDGRISLIVNEEKMEMRPPSIPDGLYKMLAILAAIELRPRFLLIDEMEASLHARMVQYATAELKACDSNVIVATHSPVVIDSVEPEDLILLEKTDHETFCRRVKDPDELKVRLMNKGITVSESWIYDKI